RAERGRRHASRWWSGSTPETPIKCGFFAACREAGGEEKTRLRPSGDGPAPTKVAASALSFKRPRTSTQHGAAAVLAPGDCFGFAIGKATERLRLVEGLLIGARYRGGVEIAPFVAVAMVTRLGACHGNQEPQERHGHDKDRDAD